MFSLVSAVAVHSKGNMILFPWGYAADPPPHPNAEEMVRLLALSHLRHYAKQVLKHSKLGNWQQGHKGPNRDLLHDCEILANPRLKL